MELCLAHALRFRPLLRRSLAVAFLVGTVLTTINQGTAFVVSDLGWALAWKVPLNYAVPYCVSTAGALLNSRRQAVSATPGPVSTTAARKGYRQP